MVCQICNIGKTQHARQIAMQVNTLFTYNIKQNMFFKSDDRMTRFFFYHGGKIRSHDILVNIITKYLYIECSVADIGIF